MPIYILIFLQEITQLFLLFQSQCRGINISLECVTNLLDGENIKTKFFNRKGFAKAYEEMKIFMKDSAKKSNVSVRAAIASRSETKKTFTKQTTLRRSPRLNRQPEVDTPPDVRRSARIATRNSFNT